MAPCPTLLRLERRIDAGNWTILNSRRTLTNLTQRTRFARSGEVGATSFASLRRFCAIAASVNSNWAPRGLRNRNRPSCRAIYGVRFQRWI